MLVKMKCPHCGANMEVNDALDTIMCTYCGSKIANLKERIEVTQNVNVSGVVKHIMDRSNDPNLIISYATTNPSVVMVVRIVKTGQKNTYLNGQTQTYHLQAGVHQIVLKIGKKNYDRTIVIPADNSPVRINATFNGRRAEITIDQPNVTVTDPVTGRQSQQMITQNNKKQSVLAIISFILSFLLHAAFLAVPLAILDLVLSKKDKDHRHGLAIAALIIGTIMCFVIIMTYASDAKCFSPKTYTYQSELIANNTKEPALKWEEAEAQETETKITALDPVATSELVEISGATDTPEPTAAPSEQVITPEPVIVTPDPTPEVITTGIRPEFQKAMDEYLDFFKNYCEFMKEYIKAPSAAMAIRYFELLKEYQEAITALEKMDTKDMTKEEEKLYLDTLNTINKMLINLQ